MKKSLIWREDGGVTPIIGTVLILFIVILAIGGILLWGVPAIQGIQEHAEFQSVLNQFVEANGDINNLRDPQSTRLDRISVNRGELTVQAGSRWVFIAVTDATYTSFSLANWDDTDPTTVGLSSLPADAKATLYKVVGGVITQLSTCASGCTSLSLGTAKIYENAFRVLAEKNGQTKAEAWIFNVGRISYIQSRASELNRMYIEMGAVVAQQGKALFMEEPPAAIKDPALTATPKDTLYFARAIELNGTSSVSGKGRFPLLLNLIDNYGTARGRPSLESTVSVRIQIDDDQFLEEAFCNHLKSRQYYSQAGGNCASGSVNLLYQPPETFFYELNHAVVSALVKTV